MVRSPLLLSPLPAPLASTSPACLTSFSLARAHVDSYVICEDKGKHEIICCETEIAFKWFKEYHGVKVDVLVFCIDASL